MAEVFKNGEEYYNRVYLLFNFFIAISLLPFGYLLLLRQTGQLVSDIKQPWVWIFALLLSIVAIIFHANRTFKFFLNSVDNKDLLREKLISYKKASLKKYFSFLLASLICVSGLYLTNSTLFVIGYIVTTILLSIKRPTLNTIIEDLELNEQEQQILIKKEPIP